MSFLVSLDFSIHKQHSHFILFYSVYVLYFYSSWQTSEWHSKVFYKFIYVYNYIYFDILALALICTNFKNKENETVRTIKN
jgi:hypothetical protein